MTFLIEPGLALPQAKAKSDHAESKMPTGGSGDAFARSLQEGRNSAETNDGVLTPIKDNTSETEQTIASLSLLQDDENAAAVEGEVILGTGDSASSDETEPNEHGLSSAEVKMPDESSIGRNTPDGSEEDDADNATLVTSVIEAPKQVAQTSVKAETTKDTAAESAPSTNLHPDTDTQLNDTPPQSDTQAMTVVQGEIKHDAARTSDKDMRLKASIAVEGSTSARARTSDTTPQQTTRLPGGRDDILPSDKSPASKGDGIFLTDSSDASPVTSPEAGKTSPKTHTSPTADGTTQPAVSVFGTPSVSQTTAQPTQSQIQMTPTQAVITASPAETVKIITDTVASPDDTPDRVTVQLDPPELGRVSIDFKFDANGLQHITVTGDSPEALRQLRLMHFELTQALERNGLSSQNMTFQQHQSGQQQPQTPTPGRPFNNSEPAADIHHMISPNPIANPIRPARTASGGLDIRV